MQKDKIIRTAMVIFLAIALTDSLNPLGITTNEKIRREKISENNARYWKGKIFSEEHCKRIGKGKKGAKHTEETKKKMSEAHLGVPSIWKGKMRGKNHPQWKGDEVSYVTLHQWVKRWKQKPEFCEICNKKPPHDLHNISGEYKRDVNDFEWLCNKCHQIKDGRYDKNKKRMKENNPMKNPEIIKKNIENKTKNKIKKIQKGVN